MAQADKANSQAILNRYTTLVEKGDQRQIEKFKQFSAALELATDANLQNRLINLLGNTHTYQALLIVEPYMDKKETAVSAAAAVQYQQ